MSVKQDRAHTRTASQLEQKYSFGKTFAEMMGLIHDARDSVDSVESTLRNEITQQVTFITRNTEQIIMSALASYETTADAEQFKQTVESELAMMAEKISMNFSAATEKIETVDGEIRTVIEELQKHFDFNVNGLTISDGGNLKLRVDSGGIGFYKGAIDEDDLTKNRFGFWDGNNFYTGNLVVRVDERAQFGNFAFVPRSNGSLSFLKVGG